MSDKTLTVEELKAQCVAAINRLLPNMLATIIGYLQWGNETGYIYQPIVIRENGEVYRMTIEIRRDKPDLTDMAFYATVLAILSKEQNLPSGPGTSLDRDNIEASRQLMLDGAEMETAKQILNDHLRKVSAALLRSPGQWHLMTSIPFNEKEVYASFAQAFDVALTLLENRAGHGAVVVTPSDKVAKEAGRRD